MRRLTRRQKIGAALLTAVALLFISLDFAGGSLSGARGGTTGSLGSLYRGTDAVLGPLRRFVQGIPDVGTNRKRLAALERQNRQLNQQLQDERVDAATAKRLATLQLQADSAGLTLLPARVIATGPGAGFEWTVTVDVGNRENVQAGQTVTDGYGLVGRVAQVYSTSSVILLAADPAFGVGARDTEHGTLLLANGAGSSGLIGSPIGAGTTVKTGDHLVTGPAGASTFVSGISIGVVQAVTSGGDGTVKASIRPTAAMTGLNLLAIVLRSPVNAARPAITPGGGG